MKMNVKGLVFVGFAAAVFAGAANAAGDKIVTSKTYVDAKISNAATISSSSTTTAPNEKAVYDALATKKTASELGTAAAVNTTTTITEGGTDVPTAGAVYNYVSTAGGNFQSIPGANDGQKVAAANGGWEALDTDATPTANSTKPVQSGGVLTALNAKANTADLGSAASAATTTTIAENGTGLPTAGTVYTYVANQISGASGNYQAASATAEKQFVADGDGGWEALDVDDTVTDGSSKPVTSGAVYAALTTTERALELKQNANTAVTHTANTAAGSATQPVYIAQDGTATATTYELNATVPANAVFTDTTYAADNTTIELDTTGATPTFKAKAGSVASGNTGLVSGGQVYTAIDTATNGKTFEPSTTGCTAYPCALVMTAAGTYGWENIQQAPAGN